MQNFNQVELEVAAVLTKLREPVVSVRQFLTLRSVTALMKLLHSP